ncbi:hypothetical protein AC249_AIPGENE8919 [Exaiptasia diaphana]|nr:hypothetical protein AC249_AIPGENE8919 [Exaiptasia diaphana]
MKAQQCYGTTVTRRTWYLCGNRVVTVSHSHEIRSKVKRVFILNPNGVRMAQWDDVDFKNGIANVEMPLSKQPVFGKWTIVASYRLTDNRATVIASCPHSVAWECASGGEIYHECTDDSQCYDGLRCCESDCGTRRCVSKCSTSDLDRVDIVLKLQVQSMYKTRINEYPW